jgi:hypothetical protein
MEGNVLKGIMLLFRCVLENSRVAYINLEGHHRILNLMLFYFQDFKLSELLTLNFFVLGS